MADIGREIDKTWNEVDNETKQRISEWRSSFKVQKASRVIGVLLANVNFLYSFFKSTILSDN